MIEIDANSTRKMDMLGRLLSRSGDVMTPLVRRNLARQMAGAVSQWRQAVSGKFKVRRSKVGNSFKWYAAGDKLDNVRAGTFTRWAAAPVYERGGHITGRGAMAVPIHPRAFTKDGRVKKKWRDPRNFPDLFKITTRRGAVLLVQGKKQVKTEFAQKKFGMEVGQFRSFEPAFVLLRGTRRRPVLNFVRDMTRLFDQVGAKMGPDVLKGLDVAVEGAIK